MRGGRYRTDETGGVTVGQANDRWAKDNERKMKRFDVEEARIRKLKTFRIDTGIRSGGKALEGKIVDIAIKDLKIAHIESLIDVMDDEGMAGGTIRLYLSVIQRSWVHSMRQPAVMCPTGQARNRPGAAKDRDRRLEVGEEARLMAIAGADFKPVLRFTLETAARQAEIANLEWCDVDFRRRSAKLYADETKTGEARSLPLSLSAMTMLREIPRRIDNSFVFGLTAEAIKKRMRRITKRAGIANLRFHDLTHESISRMFEDTDLTDIEISSISGHKTMQMLRRYAHLRTHRLAGRLDGMGRGRA